jgi:hypothetical protein
MAQGPLTLDRAGKFMPPVIPLLDGSNSSSTRSNLRFADAAKTHEMTLLLSGAANGVLSLGALGASCIGSVQICVPSEDSSKLFGVEIKHISAAPDLSRLAVLVESTGADLTEQRCPAASQVLMPPHAMAHKAGSQFIAVIDTQTVASNSGQLLQISCQASILESAMSSLHAWQGSMHKTWKDAWEHMSGKFKVLEKALADHGSASTPENELLTCVASGCASASLQHFLTTLREQGIRRWDKTMESASSSIQHLIHHKMIPVTQALIFRAGEQLGLARWHERFLPLGLSESAVEAVVREGQGTLHKLTEIAAVARSFHKGVSLLCAWLEKLSLRLLNDTGSTCMSSDDALAVAKFIRSHLSSNRVGALLQGSEAGALVTGSQEDENPNAELLSALKLTVPSSARVSLGTQLQRLKDAAETCMAGTKQTISTKLSIDACIALHSPSSALCAPGDVPVVAMTPCGVSQTQEGGDSKGGCGFMIVMLHPLQTTSIPPLRFLRLNHAPGMFSTAVCVFVGVCRALYLMRLLLVRGADARRD